MENILSLKKGLPFILYFANWLRLKKIISKALFIYFSVLSFSPLMGLHVHRDIHDPTPVVHAHLSETSVTHDFNHDKNEIPVFFNEYLISDKAFFVKVRASDIKTHFQSLSFTFMVFHENKLNIFQDPSLYHCCYNDSFIFDILYSSESIRPPPFQI